MSDLFKRIDKIDMESTPERIEKLKKHIANNPLHMIVNNEFGFTPFTYTLGSKKLSTFKILYNAYLENKGLFERVSNLDLLNMTDANRSHPIDIVTYLNDKDDRLEKLKFLITIGVDTNVQDRFGNTPLHTLTKKNDDTAVELILTSANINVNVLNNKEETPISLSIKNNNENILDLLIEAGGFLQGHIGDKYVNYREQILRSKNKNLIEYLLEYDKTGEKRLVSRLKTQMKKEYVRKRYKEVCSVLNRDNLKDIQNFAKELNINIQNKSKEQLCSQIARKVVIREYNPTLSFTTDF